MSEKVQLKSGRLATPVREAFSYGIRYFIVIPWSMTLCLNIESQQNMRYPVWKCLTYWSLQPPYWFMVTPLYTEAEVFRPPIYAYGKCKKSAQTLIVYCVKMNSYMFT